MTLTRYLRRMRLLQKQETIFLKNRHNVNINMLKNIIKDEANLESMTDRKKIFRVESLLRPYVPCENKNTDKVRYPSQGLIKRVRHTQVNKS